LEEGSNELDFQPGALRAIELFAGAGGGILAGEILGWQTVLAVEVDEYARDVLVARQNDKCLAPFPIFGGDIRDFDARPWRGCVDVVAGGFPCTEVSAAGTRTGLQGESSGLWEEFRRTLCQSRPEWAFVENVPNLTACPGRDGERGLGTVLLDLAALGFDVAWGVLGAFESVGAPHKRDRIWIVGHNLANADRDLQQRPSQGGRSDNRNEEGNDSCGSREDMADPDSLDRGTGIRQAERAGNRNEIINCNGNLADADGGFGKRKDEEVQARGDATDGSREAVADADGKRRRGGNPRRSDAMDADARGQDRVPFAGAVRTDEGFACNRCGEDVFNGCRHYHGEWQCKDCGNWTYPFHYKFEDGCQSCGSRNVSYPDVTGLEGWPGDESGKQEPRRLNQETGRPVAPATFFPGTYWWATEPGMGGELPDGMAPELDVHGADGPGSVPRVAKGIRSRIQRIKCIGNGQVPACAAMAFLILAPLARQQTEENDNI
jgi:site-specific DNA-cytosine methylase